MDELQEQIKNLLLLNYQLEDCLENATKFSRMSDDWEKLLNVVNKTEEIVQKSKFQIQKRHPSAKLASLVSSTSSNKSSSSTTSASQQGSSYSRHIDAPIPITTTMRLNKTQTTLRPLDFRASGYQTESKVRFDCYKPKIPSPSHTNSRIKRDWLEDGKASLDPYRIFLPKVAPSTTENTLKSAFSHYGNVKEAKILKNPDGSPRGKAFISFESTEIAKQLVQKTMTVNGSEVTVQPFFNKSKPENKPGQQSSRTIEKLIETTTSRKVEPVLDSKAMSSDKYMPGSATVCMLCRSGKVNCVLLWCGHGGVCFDCGGKLKVCPKLGCGQTIEKVTKL